MITLLSQHVHRKIFQRICETLQAHITRKIPLEVRSTFNVYKDSQQTKSGVLVSTIERLAKRMIDSVLINR